MRPGRPAGTDRVPAHRIGQVDDILVAGQHQIFALRAGRSDIDRADFLDIDRAHRLERGGQGQADAGREGAAIFAEQGDDAAFLRADPVETGQHQPKDDDNADGDRPQRPAVRARRQATEAAALAKAFAALAQQFLDRGGGFAAGRLAGLGPGIARAITAPAGPVLARSVIALRPVTLAAPGALGHGARDAGHPPE
jgi:hypothetical protein